MMGHRYRRGVLRKRACCQGAAAVGTDAKSAFVRIAPPCACYRVMVMWVWMLHEGRKEGRDRQIDRRMKQKQLQMMMMGMIMETMIEKVILAIE